MPESLSQKSHVCTSRSRQSNGYTSERVRAPLPGRDLGLYIFRTPDRRSRTAIIRGIESSRPPVPHRVFELAADGITLGAEIARYFPSIRHIPDDYRLINAVGEWRDAIRFAMDHARGLALASTTQETTP